MATTRKRTDDAYAIARRRFIDGSPEAESLLEDVEQELAIARTLYDLRTAAGLSQRQLAARAGTTATMIGRIEEADSGGQSSLALLQRIAAALGHRARILIEPLSTQPTPPP